MAGNQALADEFTENFNYPIRQVDLLGSQARVDAAITRTAARSAVPVN